MKYRQKLKTLLLGILSILLLMGCGAGNRYVAEPEEAATSAVSGGAGQAFAPISAEVSWDDSFRATSAGNESFDMAADEAYVENEMREMEGEAAYSGQFMIHTASASILSTDFDEALITLNRLTEKYQGFVQQSNINAENPLEVLRWASFTIRVPAESYQTMLDSLDEVGNVSWLSTNVENVSARHADIQSRLTALRSQENRLLELIDRAETMEDLILLESNLSDVIRQIENLTTERNTLDNLINYSTIQVSIQEVTEEDLYQATTIEPSGFSNLGNTFTGSIGALGNFGMFLITLFVALIPWLIILGIIAFIVVRIVKKRKVVNGETGRVRVIKKNKISASQINSDTIINGDANGKNSIGNINVDGNANTDAGNNNSTKPN